MLAACFRGVENGGKWMFASSNTALVSPGEDSLILRGLSTEDADARLAGLFQRDTPHGGFRLFLNLCFASRASAPVGEREAVFDGGFELDIIFRFGRIIQARF